MRIRIILAFLALTGVAACTPSEQQYCERMATPPGSSEYAKCVGYYFDQTGMYQADRNVCEFEADRTYPRSLYDYGRTARVRGGYGPHGYRSAQTIDIAPDHGRNAMIDQLRLQIVAPCMVSRGWRDPLNWEAGKGAPPLLSKPRTAPAGTALPWAR